MMKAGRSRRENGRVDTPQRDISKTQQGGRGREDFKETRRE